MPDDDGLDFPGDICERCHHVLRDEGLCPSCGWQRPRIGGFAPRLMNGDDLPGIRGG